MRDRTLGDDAVGVNVQMRLHVVRFDAVKVGRLLERRVVPVEVTHPLVDERISVTDRGEVALEVEVLRKEERVSSEIRLHDACTHVDWVETNGSGVETDVSLSQLVANEVRSPIAEELLEVVKRLKDGADG